MSNAPADPQRAELRSKILVTVLVGIFIFGMIGFALAVIDAQEPEPTQPPAPSLPAIPVLDATPGSGPEAAGPRIRLALAELDAPPSPSVSPSPLPSDAPAAVPSSAPLEAGASGPSTMPVVPVTRFWSKREGMRTRDVAQALERGVAKGFRRVLVEEGIADALAAALDIELHPDVRRADIERIERAVRRGALAMVAAADATPSLRMLELDGVSLVGSDRVEEVDDWPLSLRLIRPEAQRWDQDRTWVLVAGGDSFTDRGVYDTVVRKGRGVDHPFDGGTARVTGFGCCDPVFNDNIVPRYELTGNRGAVRRLFRGADLAIANHEQPATDAAVFHRSGTRFSGKPSLTRIFSRAGIDWLSLANNHIGDYGGDGIRDTRRILRRYDIAFGGAGKDLQQARRISYLDAGPSQVAIIACLDIVRLYWADDGKAGATPCLDRYIVPDIKEASRKADLVIVFPHWGVEYTRSPLPSMRKHAARWAKAGADLVLGAHSHVAGAIEDVDGTPVLYSLGNLIFDQHWSTNTMESALLEATFHADRLIEMRLLPYIIHDQSQPNLLDPGSKEGRRLLKAIRQVSSDWLAW